MAGDHSGIHDDFTHRKSICLKVENRKEVHRNYMIAT